MNAEYKTKWQQIKKSAKHVDYSVDQSYSDPEICICYRPKCDVFCYNCGHLTQGRIRHPCPKHVRCMFMMDLPKCPNCTAHSLMMKEIFPKGVKTVHSKTSTASGNFLIRKNSPTKSLNQEIHAGHVEKQKKIIKSKSTEIKVSKVKIGSAAGNVKKVEFRYKKTKQDEDKTKVQIPNIANGMNPTPEVTSPRRNPARSVMIPHKSLTKKKCC